MDFKQIAEQLQNATAEFKSILDRQEAEIKKHGEVTGETKGMIEKLNDRIDQLETKMKRPLDFNPDGDPVLKEQKDMMLKYMRTGEVAPEMRKSMSTDSNPDGGYFLPTQISSRIITLVREISPVRQVASVETISSTVGLDFPKEGSTDFDAGWVGERQTRAETTSGTIAMENVPLREMYAKPKATQRLLDDPAFNFENFINTRVARRFSQLEGTGFVSGDGINQPMGFLTGSVVGEIASGVADNFTPDSLLALEYGLYEAYTRNASYMMRRATVRVVRQFKDGMGRYLWQPSMQAGQPASLNGYPLLEAPDMPAVAAGTYPIAFGDFRAGYQIVDNANIRILRDPYSAKPFIEFYTTRYTGGKVVLGEALKKLKIAVSV
jgi:HK97 family phage major capsid protein